MNWLLIFNRTIGIFSCLAEYKRILDKNAGEETAKKGQSFCFPAES